MSLISKYGNPAKGNGKLDQKWYAANITSVRLPFPMRLSWKPGVIIHAVPFHRLAADALSQALTLIWRYARIEVKRQVGFTTHSTAEYDVLTLQWLRDWHLDLFGGSFNFRPIRGSSSLSMHAYGLAIDIDPEGNPMGSRAGRMPTWAVEIFRRKGFAWGGDFTKRPDPMHFEVSG